MELFRLKNKVAVVTGSSRGIGYSIAKNLALSGAKVIVTSRSDASCKKAVNKIKKLGGIAHAVSANINSKDQLNNLIKVTGEVFKKIDILVCNAATNPYYGSMSKIPDSAFIKVMNNNILSNHWLSNLVLPSMKKRRNGVILIISSIGGLRGSNSLGAYAVSKAADMQLVRNIAVENGKYNIRANCIAPGLIKTKFARALWQFFLL